MSANADVSRFAIYQQPPSDKKRYKESVNILHLLCRLDDFIKLDDVQFGQEPPDFVFYHQGKPIGVELTDLNPKRFESGGHRRREAFKQFEASIEPDSLSHEFPWEDVLLRESLTAFQACLENKKRKANKWYNSFQERWLLMRIGDGSPFGEVIAEPQDMKVESELGMEANFSDHLAKTLHGIHSICQEIHPFDYVLLFRKTNLATSVCNLVTFPANESNPHQLPVPSNEVLKHGMSVSDSFLDRKIQKSKTITIRPGFGAT